MNNQIEILQKRQSCIMTFRNRLIRSCEKDGVVVMDERIGRAERILDTIGKRLRAAYNSQYTKKNVPCVS